MVSKMDDECEEVWLSSSLPDVLARARSREIILSVAI